MGFWSEQVVPRCTHVALGTPDVRAVRRRVLAGASGVVVDLGFGSGPNVPLYPSAVTSVLAVEPSAVARRLAGPRVRASGLPIEFVGLDGESLPLADGSAETVVSTFTLCTIPDLDRALGEVRRVLAPGGTFLFLEHGLSPDPRAARWQRRLDPLQQRLFAGCHLDRAIDRRIREAGFTITELSRERLPGPRVCSPLNHLYLGASVG